MPSEAWFWTGICLWTVALGIIFGRIIGELSSIRKALWRMVKRMEEVP